MDVLRKEREKQKGRFRPFSNQAASAGERVNPVRMAAC